MCPKTYYSLGVVRIFMISFILQGLTSSFGFAQSNSVKNTVGFIVGYGDQSGLNVNYDHRVVLYKAHYGRNLVSKKAWALDIVFRPQYNVTEFRPVNRQPEKTDGIEFGLNIGFQAKLRLIENFLNYYVLVSTGPHYVSGVPKRQKDGFLFSDNIITGLNINLNRNVILDFNYGIRHISNAGLDRTNAGINNSIWGAGILFNLN